MTIPSDSEYLAAFCEALPQLRDEMQKRGKADLLDVAVRAVRSGQPVLETLAVLDIAPHVLTAPGANRGITPSGIVRGVPRPASGEMYRCPGGGCSREIAREPGGPIPASRCWLHDRSLIVGEA